MKNLKFNVNVCDQTAKDIEIHLTQKCDNKCEFCIDRMNNGIGYTGKPDVTDICLSLAILAPNAEIVSIAGGEPCLYLNELLEIIQWCKSNTKLKINLITSLPYNCYKNKEMFFEILDLIDTMTISVQHYDKYIADKIRNTNTPTRYNRNEFYKSLPHKEKISITINSMYGFLDTKKDIIDNILYFNELGFTHIKLCEIMKYDKMFVNIEDTLGIKHLGEPFASGCNIPFDINPIIHTIYPDRDYKGTFNLKRQCFYTTNKRHANIFSLIKVLFRRLFCKKYLFAVIYEDGSIHNYWE